MNDSLGAEFGALIRSQLEAIERQSADAEALVKLLKRTGRERSHLALTYRCQRRCSLLELYRTPSGIVMHFPRYRLSAAVNASTSSEEGRIANTEDGDRRWKARSAMFDAGFSYALNCAHLKQSSVSGSRISDDLQHGTREVTIAP